MIVELESRAAAASISLTSSFAPRCAHLLQLELPRCPSPKKVFHRVVASTKQKKKARKPSSPARGWSYEHFMVLWDEVFGHCCTDPVKATQIRNIARAGLAKHGRGCVLVYQEVQTRPRGAGTGFTSKPAKSSRSVPDFVTVDYYAVYLPREFLLDPRKAPLDEDTAVSDEKEHPNVNAGHARVENQVHESHEINNTVERQPTDSRADTLIDIEDIVREAQNVYSFYSDDEDESDAEVHSSDDSLLCLDDKEDSVNSAYSSYIMDKDVEKVDSEVNLNDSLLILDDFDTRATDGLITLDDDIRSVSKDGKEADSYLKDDAENVNLTLHNTNITNCADELESFNYLKSPLISSDDKADPHANEPLFRETLHEESLSAKPDLEVSHECAEHEDNSNVATHSLQENRRDGRNAEDLEECAANSLKEDDKPSEEQSERNGVTHVRYNGLDYGAKGPPMVELVEESLKDDTIESSDLVAYVKGDLRNYNESSDDVEVPLTTQRMLYACMRGVDRTRLMSLTANFDFEAEKFRFARKMAVIDVKTADAGGEDPYNPNEEELVLLLHLCIDGKPAYGADVVVAYRDERQTDCAVKDSWKLGGKYKQVIG